MNQTESVVDPSRVIASLRAEYDLLRQQRDEARAVAKRLALATRDHAASVTDALAIVRGWKQ